MESNQKFRLPLWAIVLDILGTVMLVLGILALFGGDGALFPETPEIRALAFVLIFAGVLLMLPLIIIIIRRATSQN